MSPVQFASYCRLQTKTNTATFTDANLLIYMNIWKDEIAGKVVDMIDEEYFGVPQTTDLNNGQREYPLPLDLPGKLKKVEAVLDPTYLDSNNNPVWVDLKKFSLEQLNARSQNLFTGVDSEDDNGFVAPTTDEDTIQKLFGNRQGQAAFMIFRNSLWIFSGTLANFPAIPNNMLKLWGYEWPSDITDLTSTVPLEYDPDNQDAGIPRQLHKVWADKVILMKKQDSDKAYQMSNYESEIDTILDQKVMSLAPEDKNESYSASQPRNYHDGFDL